MIGKDVFVKVDARQTAGTAIYPAAHEHFDALAWLPAGRQSTLRGHIVAQVLLDGKTMALCAPYGVEITQAQIRKMLPGAQVTDCLYEKSCGAVVFYVAKGALYYLLIENRCHNWGFPKGHVEINETELETASREILEETGLQAQFLPGFRQSVQYYVREGVRKTAVYFIAEVFSDQVRVPAGEISSFALLQAQEACQRLTYASERELLRKAERFILAARDPAAPTAKQKENGGV